MYPSGLRERSAKPLFAGSNPAMSSTNASVAELVDAHDLGSCVYDVRVRVSPEAHI